MNHRWLSRLGFPLLLLLLSMVPAPAAPVEADPNKDYHVTPDVGPFMIIVTSYSGADAAKFAHALCYEIRSSYHMPAFIYNRGAEERRQQDEALRQKRKQQQEWFAQNGYQPDSLPPLKRYRIEEQYAVLVGSFKDMDAARKELTRIKKLDAPKSVPLDVWNVNGQEQGQKKDGNTQVKVNPFAQSFVVRNPTVKFEPEPEKPDPFLKELNAGEEFSLLQVKKPWTLVVKDFYGQTVIQPQSAPDSFMKKLFGDKKRSLLDAGAHDAHEIARGLRLMKLDAYVLHTRWGSVVTVGAYDSKDDPKLLQMKQVLQEHQQLAPNLHLFANPLPMPVPQL